MVDHELHPIGCAAEGLALAVKVKRTAAGHQPQVAAQLAAGGVEALGPAPQPQEDVLDDVLGLRGTPEDPVRSGEDAAVSNYKAALDEDLPANIRSTVERQYVVTYVTRGAESLRYDIAWPKARRRSADSRASAAISCRPAGLGISRIG